MTISGVKLELLECPNCLDQHNDKVKTVEGTLMTLRCSTNLNHSLQYWMMFKHDYNASTESRIAYCSPNNPDENKHKTGDAHWSVYRKNNKCILKVEQCNSMDIGTYTCAVIPIDTNNNEALKFMSEQMVVDIESVPPVPPPGHKCDLKYYVIALSIVAGALLCITVIVVITSVCIWYRNKQPDPPIHHPGEQHQEQLRQHDLPGPHQANRPGIIIYIICIPRDMHNM